MRLVIAMALACASLYMQAQSPKQIKGLGELEVVIGRSGTHPIAAPLASLFEGATVNGGKITIALGEEVLLSDASDVLIDAAIGIYGFCPSHSYQGNRSRASTLNATQLHQFNLSGVGGEYRVLPYAATSISASFNYIVGKAYYLQDDGTLDTEADDDFDSMVCYVIASLGAGKYILDFKTPRHFAR